jgi:6-phosphogluconolactonase (cycloisomerase 2 family)
VIYLGSDTAGSGEGVGVVRVRNGALSLESTAACPPRPSYLVLAPDWHTLYAAHELEEGW